MITALIIRLTDVLSFMGCLRTGCGESLTGNMLVQSITFAREQINVKAMVKKDVKAAG